MKKVQSQLILECQLPSRKTLLNRNSSLRSMMNPSEKQANNLSLNKVNQNMKNKYAPSSNLLIDTQNITFYKGEIQSHVINIQNQGKNLLKVCLTYPKTKYFIISQENKNFQLSSGMSKKISIQVNTNAVFDDQNYCDEVYIATQNSRDKVKLVWLSQKPLLNYANLVDLKTIDLGRLQKFNITLQNRSTTLKIGKIRLIKDAWDNIQITPDEFSLEPKKITKVEIGINPQSLGAYHHKIVAEVDDNLMKPIQIIYSAIDFTFRLENSKQQRINDLDFGDLLRGSRKQIYLYAHNNSPNEVEIKSKIKIGQSLRAESTLQSPQELGIEFSSTVIEILNKSLKIAPFSRKKLTLVAESPVEDKHRLLVDRLAVSENISLAIRNKICDEESVHREILVCEMVQISKKGFESESNQKNNILVLPMQARFSLPLIKVTPNSLNLGKVFVGGTIQSILHIQNLSNKLKVSLQVNKLFSFDLLLMSQTLNYKQSTQMKVFLKGTNIGIYKVNAQITICNLYTIRIPLEYEVANNTAANNQQKLWKTGHYSLHNTSQDGIDFNKTLASVTKHKSKSKYDRINFRRSMAKSKSSKSLMQKDERQQADIVQSIRNSTKGKQNASKQKLKGEQGATCGLNEGKLSMSNIKSYNLFVTKKIDKYLPYQQLRQHKKLQKTKNTKEYFNNVVRRSPKNRKQAQQIQRQLSPEQLKLITISQKIINFGRIFIKSRIQKQFIIGNNTQSAIIAQLHHTSNDSKKIAFLSQSDMQPQIIGQNGAARFRIIFNALYCGKYESTLSYTINGVHTFHLLVEADVELVSLNISKNSLKMAYLDDINQILLKDNFILKNDGNIPAKFNILQSSSKYVIQPESGVLASGENMTVWVMENNQNYPIVQAGDVYAGKMNKTISNLGDDRILIKIADGNDISLKIVANPALSDPKCIVKESKIIFGCTIVSKPKSKTFQLKNLSRSICLFEIFNEQCEEFLTFDCMKGRVPPEGAKDITITYKSNLLHALTSNFQILIRGGLIINVPIQAQSVAPQVSIIQPQLNFGDVCCDTAAVKTINIKNESQTLIQLYADLRNNRDRGAQFLTISLWNSVTTPVGQKSKQVSNNYRSASFQEEIIDNAIKECGVHKIRIDSKSILSFYLVYKPITMGYYEFVLPLFLQNFIRNEELSKIVSCNAIEPKFIIEPNIIKFKKKIINDKENSCFHPYVQFLTLRNPTDKVLKWKLDVHGQHKTGMSFSSYSSVPTFGNKKEMISPKICFQIEEKRGQLKPKDSVSINVSFNPLQQGFYCHKIPLFIFNEQKGTYHQQAQIRLEGEGKYPSLYFNRKQLIMPVVPIGIQSISMLQIYNEGYETINLKHRFQIMDSQGNIFTSKGNLMGQNNFPQIMAVFPEGNKLTMNKRQTFVILKFVAKKSISFTCKFQIYDESVDCRAYSINISGTADNSLLTTFTYLSDTQNIFRLQPSITDFIDTKKSQKNKSEQLHMNSSLSVALKINDGRNLIDRYHSIYDDKSIGYYGLDCRIIKRWLNNFFREEKVRDFPVDLSQNKEILLRLLYKLTGKKQFDGNWEFQIQGVGKQILNGENNSLTFYEQILRLLKTMGCLLNHIRPYYLLQRQDYLQYMGKDQNWMMYSDYYTKKYDIIYREAWIILFYQIIEQFWCGRIRCQTSSKVISNVYSNYQLQIIRWVKGIYEEFNQLQDSKAKFLSFGNDFKDCVAPIFCLMKYNPSARKIKSLQNLNRKPISPNQFNSNTKILYQMLEKLNIVPLIYEDEYQLCKQKQFFMFMYQLYQLLPQTVPKLPPIIFACELGESCSRIVDIKNPSNKAVHYWVKLQGCKDFTYDEKQSILIQPKAVYPFKVDYKSRLSTQQSAFISFFSKQQAQANSINGSALVFQLRSNITGRKSLKKLQSISSPLYQTTSIKILVENIFEDHQLANFTITLFQQLVDGSNHNLNLSLKKKQDTIQIIQNIFQKENNINVPIKPTAFYTQCDSLKIKKGSATSFDLHFTPLKLSKTKCFIIFSDPSVGQFQYQIIGISQIPKPLQEIKHQSNIYVGNKDYLDLSLSVYNSYMLKCESYYQQRNVVGSARKNMSKDKTQEKYKLELNMDAKILDYITFPSQVTLKTSKKDQFGGVQHQNKIKIQYNFPHILKDLTLDFLLIGDAKRDIQDVRRFKISLNIVHKPLSQELIMTTTARKPICQLIPLDNTSGKDWKIKAAIVQNQNGWLSLKQGQKINNKQLIVKKGQTQALSLCFEPKWVGKIHGRINIHNVTTNQQLIFIIRGVSQEPLSQNHFFLKVNTQDSTLFTVPINNPYNQRLTFRILSDIDELQLPPQITMQPSQQIQFNFIAETIVTTPQIGFLKFIDDNGRFFWYTITLECSQKKLRQFWVEIVTEVDKQIEKLVQFKNPYNKSLKFKCQYPKECYLEAKQEFSINPHSIHQYKIKYRPIKPMNTQISLKVFNKDIGNFIYHIKLIAKQQAKRKIHTLSVEVGKIGSLDFKLQNNFKEPIKVNYQISNKNAFQIQIPQFLNPHTQNICKLKFKPSSEGKQNCTVKISGQHFPTKLFEIEGSGIAPYSIQIINFKAHVNQTALEVIKFNNPNPKKTLQPIKVCLSEADHGCFRIVNHSKQQAWCTQVKDLLIIPVSFQPKQKGYFQSVLTIQCFNYQWKYLLKGNTGFKQSEKINEQINCTSKQQIIKLLKIPIPQYINHPVTYFNKVQIEHQDKSLMKGLRSWMKLRLNNSARFEEGVEGDEKIVTVYLKFKPKKVFKEIVKLVLSNAHEQGPKIIYNLQVNIAPCGSENVISLEITAIKVINFDLNIGNLGLKNLQNMKTKMVKAVYCEVEKVNQHIRLKFKPNHLIFNRNRVYTDYLVIETDEEEWNFEVQFTLKK